MGATAEHEMSALSVGSKNVEGWGASKTFSSRIAAMVESVMKWPATIDSMKPASMEPEHVGGFLV